jgi:hypothetical protein
LGNVQVLSKVVIQILTTNGRARVESRRERRISSLPINTDLRAIRRCRIKLHRSSIGQRVCSCNHPIKRDLDVGGSKIWKSKRVENGGAVPYIVILSKRHCYLGMFTIRSKSMVLESTCGLRCESRRIWFSRISPCSSGNSRFTCSTAASR